MRLEISESRKQALRVSDVATLFAVTSQHIYKMTAKGMILSFRIAGAIRFDPQDLVNRSGDLRSRGGGEGHTLTQAYLR
jgi:hypothetical protein